MEKKYLKLRHKLAYGAGDMGCNYSYGFITSFMLLYLTNQVGLNAGIIGTLMMVSRIFDGFSDVIMGTIIDRTNTKSGKAKPWMFWTIIPMAICQILLFNVPEMGETLQYVYFFIVYTLINVIFYTANNIAYATLSILITSNKHERVQLGVFRFIFATTGSLVVAILTMGIVDGFGGGVVGWRMASLIFTIMFMILEYISVLSIKELSPEELGITELVEKPNFVANIKYVLRNKYFIMQLLIGTLYNVVVNVGMAVGIYYMLYLLDNAAMLGVFQLTMVIPLVLSLSFTPLLTKKFGIYKTNLIGFAITTISCIPFAYFGMKGQLLPMIIFSSFRWLGAGPQIGNSTALTAEISKYSYLKDKVRLEATMFATTSMGSKVGMGLGTAVAGWLLAASQYNGLAEVQPHSALSMITFLYTGLPLIISSIMMLILYFQKVEKANYILENNS